MTQTDSRRYGLQNINQALDLIDVLLTISDRKTLTTLSDHLGMSKNKVFRLLATLEERDFIVRSEQGDYRLSSAAFSMARKISERESVAHLARPIMRQLAETCGEAIYLAVPAHGSLILRDVAECRQTVRATSFVGSPLRIPDAAGSDLWVDAGILLDRDIATIAAPIRSTGDDVAAALVILAPLLRISTERIENELAAPLRTAARQLALRLGLGPARSPMLERCGTDRRGRLRSAALAFPDPHTENYHHGRLHIIERRR